MMIFKGLWKGDGVFNVEQLPPKPFMDEIGKQGLPWHVRELEPTSRASCSRSRRDGCRAREGLTLALRSVADRHHDPRVARTARMAWRAERADIP